ncbi:MAG: tetratricopeptide repeat protein [Bacteroidales bacterium]
MKKIKFLLSGLFLATLSFGQTPYDQWVQRSFSALEADSVEQAEIYLQSALRLEPANPQNFMLLTNLGTIQRQLGKYEDALLAYSSALMIVPKSIPLLNSRAALYSELEQWEKAEEDYTTILYLKEDHEDALYRRGFIRFEKGDTLGARTDFERLIKENKTSAKGRLGIAALLKSSGDYVMAADMYGQVIKANPKQADLYLKRAEVYYLDGKLSKGISDINRSIELRSEDPLAYVVRARLRFAQYDKVSARKDFIKAKELGFKDPMIEEWIRKCK